MAGYLLFVAKITVVLYNMLNAGNGLNRRGIAPPSWELGQIPAEYLTT